MWFEYAMPISLPRTHTATDAEKLSTKYGGVREKRVCDDKRRAKGVGEGQGEGENGSDETQRTFCSTACLQG